MSYDVKHSVKMIIVSIVALSLVAPFMAPAYASDVPATQSDCEKAGMTWKPKAGKCKPIPKDSLSPAETQADCEKAGMEWKPNAGKCKRMGESSLSLAESILALIGLGCALVGLFFTWIEYRNDPRKKAGA